MERRQVCAGVKKLRLLLDAVAAAAAAVRLLMGRGRGTGSWCVLKWV